MANRAQGPQPTFMTSEQFSAHAHRILGGYGWQTKLAPLLCYSRTHVGRLGGGRAAISAPVAMTILALVDCFEKGLPLTPPRPVDKDGASYMTGETFARHGQALFGWGWQTRMAEFLGYTRIQIGRFVDSRVPIPASIATATLLMLYMADFGQPLVPLKPVGTIDADGTYRNVNVSRCAEGERIFV